MKSFKKAKIENGKIVSYSDSTELQTVEDDEMYLSGMEYEVLRAVRGNIGLLRDMANVLEERMAKVSRNS